MDAVRKGAEAALAAIAAVLLLGSSAAAPSPGPVTQTSVTVTGLECGTTYTVDVTPAGGATTSMQMATAACDPPPPPPQLGSALPPLLGPSTGTARYVSPVGSNVGDCAAITSPCATFARAETVAQPGDTVYFRAGTYTQNVSIDKVATAANPVTFRSYPGETAILHAASTANEMIRVECGARGVRIQGFKIEATPQLWTGTGHQALAIYGATCGAQDIEVNGNLFEGYQAGTTTRHDLTPTLAGPMTQRVHYIGNTVRHWGPGAGQRQGIYFQGQNGLIANNLVYDGLHGFGIQVRGESSSVFTNGVIVSGNTVVDWPKTSTAGGRGIAIEDTVRGIRIRNNVSAFSVSGQAELYGIDSNLSADPPASSNRAFTNLVWDISTVNCGNTSGHTILDFSDGLGVYTACGQNLRGDPVFVNRAAGDFQLGAGSAAVGYADPDWILPFDITGKGRDADPDAGAFER